jgi:hypothetical protein
MDGRRCDEDGAQMVELAIVMSLLSLLVFGIIEFGFLFFNHISLNQGVREGARQAAVGCYNGAPPACTGGSSTTDLVAYTKSRIGLKNADTYVHVGVPAGATVGQEITVCAYYPRDSITGLMQRFIGGYSFSEVRMRLERIPKNVTLASGGDAAPPSKTWPAQCA